MCEMQSFWEAAGIGMFFLLACVGVGLFFVLLSKACDIAMPLGKK